jgi:hypothetical protein
MSIYPSVRMEEFGFHWTDFDETWYLRLFRKSVEKIQISLKSDKDRELYMKTFRHFWRYHAKFYLEWEMF